MTDCHRQRGTSKRVTSRARLVAFAVLTPALLNVTALMSVASASERVAVGTAEITQPGLTTPLRSGGPATHYGVLLPAGARCPGDTAKDGYRVFSYLVPGGVSPTQVSFKGVIPSRYYGYIALGEYYFGAENTAPDTGQILGMPAFFVFSRLTPGFLFDAGATEATWDGGIACANDHGQVTNYWNTRFVFTASSSDPGGFTWRVEDPIRVPVAGQGGFPTWLALVLAGCALVAAGVVLNVGRRTADKTKAAREAGPS